MHVQNVLTQIPTVVRQKERLASSGLSVEVIVRQTRAAVSPREDFANTNTCRRGNRLQKIDEV